MQYSQEHLKTMVYAEFGGQTECIMGNWKIENWQYLLSENHELQIYGNRHGLSGLLKEENLRKELSISK